MSEAKRKKITEQIAAAGKKRKLIALILNEIEDPYRHDSLEGVLMQAYKLDYNVAVFAALMNPDGTSLMSDGEEKIYDLINPEMFDGVIFAENTFNHLENRTKLINRLKKDFTCPIVSFSPESVDFLPIVNDESQPIFEITEHLIKKHGVRKIYCLTGFETSVIALQRAEGYKRAMLENGAQESDIKIFYGDFWIDSGLAFADKIASGMLERPEAVVCANDVMAINLCNRLIERGVRVPEDVKITGYDGSKNAMNNIPAVTTYKTPHMKKSISAVCLLHKQITGEDVEPIPYENNKMILCESCGCHRDYRLSPEQLLINRRREQYSQLFASSYMPQKLSEAASVKELIGKADMLTYLIDSFETYCLCLSSESIEDVELEKNGYPEQMNLMLEKHGYVKEDKTYSFDTRLMLPQLWDERDYPTTFYFTPLHFEDKTFGYSVVSYGKLIKCYDNIYRDWNFNLNTCIEFARIREHLSEMTKQIYINSIHDNLTELYNRKGYDDRSGEFFGKALSEHKKLLFVVADLDGLKKINDFYGHLEGDNAIIAAAHILRSVCLQNELCARTGGDEFVIIGCGDYPAGMGKKIMQRIKEYTRVFNDTTDKPYELSMSCGLYFDYYSENDSPKAIFDRTDKLMYAKKRRKKTARGNR